jgi:hypothetical protein
VVGRGIELGEVGFARSLAPVARLPFDQTSEDEVLCVGRDSRIIKHILSFHPHSGQWFAAAIDLLILLNWQSELCIVVLPCSATANNLQPTRS